MTTSEKTQDANNFGPTVPWVYIGTYGDGTKCQFSLNHRTGFAINHRIPLTKNNFGCLVDRSVPQNIHKFEMMRSSPDDPIRIDVAGYVNDNDTKVDRRETWRYYEQLGWINEKSYGGNIHFDPEFLITTFNKIMNI